MDGYTSLHPPLGDGSWFVHRLPIPAKQEDANSYRDPIKGVARLSKPVAKDDHFFNSR